MRCRSARWSATGCAACRRVRQRLLEPRICWASIRCARALVSRSRAALCAAMSPQARRAIVRRASAMNLLLTAVATARGYIQPHTLSVAVVSHRHGVQLSACPFCLEGSRPGDRARRVSFAGTCIPSSTRGGARLRHLSFPGGEPFLTGSARIPFLAWSGRRSWCLTTSVDACRGVLANSRNCWRGARARASV